MDEIGRNVPLEPANTDRDLWTVDERRPRSHGNDGNPILLRRRRDALWSLKVIAFQTVDVTWEDRNVA